MAKKKNKRLRGKRNKISSYSFIHDKSKSWEARVLRRLEELK